MTENPRGGQDAASQARHPAPAADAQADDSRSGADVAEAIDIAESGTKAQGNHSHPERAKTGKAPVEQVFNDPAMTEGQRTGAGSGGAQSVVGARESDRLAGGVPPAAGEPFDTGTKAARRRPGQDQLTTRHAKEDKMPSTTPPKGDRAGSDYQRGPNPAPGGDIDTGDSPVPPYKDRNVGNPEDREGTARAFGSEEPAADPDRPESAEAPDEQSTADLPPAGTGVSATRRGEDVIKEEGKEPGRIDTGTDDSPAQRPTGESTPRDSSGV